MVEDRQSAQTAMQLLMALLGNELSADEFQVRYRRLSVADQRWLLDQLDKRTSK